MSYPKRTVESRVSFSFPEVLWRFLGLFSACFHWFAVLSPLKDTLKPTAHCCIAGAVTKAVGGSERRFSCALRVQKLCMAFPVFSSVYCVYGFGEMKSRPCNPLKSVVQTGFSSSLALKQRPSMQSKHTVTFWLFLLKSVYKST